MSKLIGATDAFIRRPFYYLGAAAGHGGRRARARHRLAAASPLLNREVRVLAEASARPSGSSYLPPGMPWRSWLSRRCWAGWAPTCL